MDGICFCNTTTSGGRHFSKKKSCSKLSLFFLFDPFSLDKKWLPVHPFDCRLKKTRLIILVQIAKLLSLFENDCFHHTLSLCVSTHFE
jgi:hypothetical protein